MKMDFHIRIKLLLKLHKIILNEDGPHDISLPPYPSFSKMPFTTEPTFFAFPGRPAQRQCKNVAGQLIMFKEPLGLHALYRPLRSEDPEDQCLGHPYKSAEDKKLERKAKADNDTVENDRHKDPTGHNVKPMHTKPIGNKLFY